MLQIVKRWFSPPATSPNSAGLDQLRIWSDQRQFTFRAVRDEGGGVIDGRSGSTAWRLEWGPAQRQYVQGFELRLRAELGFGGELQLLLINRHLQEAMETAVFEQYVEGVQTRIDDETPPEMRWLVMFPKLAGTDAAFLGERFVAVGNHKTWLARWVEGALATALAATGLKAEHPLVLMIGRGRRALRTECKEPSAAQLDGWVKLFETAVREARRAHQQSAEAHAPSTQPSLWSSSTLPTAEEQH